MATNQSEVSTTLITTALTPQTATQSLNFVTTATVATVTQVQTKTALQTQTVKVTTSIDVAASTMISSPSSSPRDAGTNEALTSSAPSQFSQNETPAPAEATSDTTQTANSEAPSPSPTSLVAAAVDSSAPSSTPIQSSQSGASSSSPSPDVAAVIASSTPSSVPTQTSETDFPSSSTSIDPANITTASDSTLPPEITIAESTTSSSNEIPTILPISSATFQTSIQSLISTSQFPSSTPPVPEMTSLTVSPTISPTYSSSPIPPSTASPLPQTASSRAVTLPAIIGMTVGGMVLLILVSTLIYIFVRRRRVPKSRESSWIGTSFGKDDIAPPSYEKTEPDNLWPAAPPKQSFHTSSSRTSLVAVPRFNRDHLDPPYEQVYMGVPSRRNSWGPSQMQNFINPPLRPSRSPLQTPIGWVTDLREPQIPQLMSAPQSPIRQPGDPRQMYHQFAVANPWWRESDTLGSAGRGILIGDVRAQSPSNNGLKRKESLQYPNWDQRTMGTPL